MTEVGHRFIETNGIRMHVAEQGSGPLVLLCHGFPKSWYSWRHQIGCAGGRRLSRRGAGYARLWPDRGSGGDQDVHAAASCRRHGWCARCARCGNRGHRRSRLGAPVAWHAALLRPDRFRAVIGLSVPYRPRGKVRPTTVMPRTNDAVFYQLYFQQPGVAEADLEADVRASVRGICCGSRVRRPFRRAASPWCLWTEGCGHGRRRRHRRRCRIG